MLLTSYERQYMDALIKIYEHGYEDGVNERTGISTKRLPGVVIQVDVEKEFPILKSKFVAAKTACREIVWIWKQQSNDIHDLKAHIWDEWADDKGTIGKAYGYQMHKPVNVYLDPVKKREETYRTYESQAHYIVGLLKEYPNSRWGVATLWNPAELSEMNLVPCCHTSTWNLDGGRLNCVLDQRSGDMPYGVPFNTTQYAQLMCMIAKELSTPEKEIKPGLLTHVIADAHIYDNQISGVELQIQYYNILKGIADDVDYTKALDIATNHPQCNVTADELVVKAKTALASEPKFVINSDNSFFDYTAEECAMEDYTSMGKIDFGDVAV